MGRCIAPDLVGMGDSEKIANGSDPYRFDTHAGYLQAFLDLVDAADGNVTLLAHDWGGPLLFDWGAHCVQEDSGEQIGRHISSWLETV